jgi:hypothetical protein
MSIEGVSPVDIRPGSGRGTRIRAQFIFDYLGNPTPDVLIARIRAAADSVIAEGVDPSDLLVDMEINCDDRYGHELNTTVYGHRPATSAEKNKITRERAASKREREAWLRAQLAQLEGEA